MTELQGVLGIGVEWRGRGNWQLQWRCYRRLWRRQHTRGVHKGPDTFTEGTRYLAPRGVVAVVGGLEGPEAEEAENATAVFLPCTGVPEDAAS